MEENKKELNKIIYFDEESITNLIYIKSGGEIELVQQQDNKNSDVFKIDSDGEFGVKGSVGKILNFLLPFNLKANISGNYSKAGESSELINTVIKNTLLTDFIELDKEELGVEIFEDIYLEPYEDSITYMKIMTPIFSAIEGNFDAGEFDVNISKLDEALRNSKGYYEMIAYEKQDRTSNIKCILRFNLGSFKNSYSLLDLTKMDLRYYAIKVGEMNLTSLKFEKIFEQNNNSKEKEKNYKEVADSLMAEKEETDNNNQGNLNPIYDVYDVILAAVKNTYKGEI